MTTFNTKNQAKRKYYYIAGILVLLLIIVSLAFNSFRKSDNCDPINSDSVKSTQNELHKQREKEPDPIQYVTIDTNSGQIRGRKTTFNNITVNTFLGIPYAKPPIGELRFGRTKPIGNWDGVRDTLQHPASCLQTDSPLVLSAFRFLNSTSNEDCLYLNVWSPAQEDQYLPVIIYIHGGAFAYGGVATEELDATALAAQQEVVVVTLQYRLGIFGFLSFDSKEPKGNMGLYDQREALNWIHSNINKFGGDQDLITVVGHGAGAVSVGLHMMTSESKFKFQRTILQGFGLFWNKETYLQSKKFSKKFAEEIECSDAPDIKECLKEANVDRLLEVQQEILEDNPVAFGPVIPSDFVSVFPTEAKDSFEFQIDFMFGVNSEDDSLFLTTFKNTKEEDLTKTDEKEETEERSTSKPILSVTTTPTTTTSTQSTTSTESTSSESSETTITSTTSSSTPSSTSSSTTTTTESSDTESSELEKEETTEAEKEDDPEEGTEESEAEGEEPTEEEKRRRRRKREVDDHITKVVCPMLTFADTLVESNRTAYIYQLSEFSSYHDEIVFGLGYPLKHKSLYDYDEIQFSKRVMKNWAQFATDGDISKSDEKWKSFTKESPMFLKMSISSVSLEKFNRNECTPSINAQ